MNFMIIFDWFVWFVFFGWPNCSHLWRPRPWPTAKSTTLDVLPIRQDKSSHWVGIICDHIVYHSRPLFNSLNGIDLVSIAVLGSLSGEIILRTVIDKKIAQCLKCVQFPEQNPDDLQPRSDATSSGNLLPCELQRTCVVRCFDSTP